MENLEKLNLIIAKIKAIKGHTIGKNNRLKYYKESLEFDRFNYITLEQIENFDFQHEVINVEKRIIELRESKKKKTLTN